MVCAFFKILKVRMHQQINQLLKSEESILKKTPLNWVWHQFLGQTFHSSCINSSKKHGEDWSVEFIQFMYAIQWKCNVCMHAQHSQWWLVLTSHEACRENGDKCSSTCTWSCSDNLKCRKWNLLEKAWQNI